MERKKNAELSGAAWNGVKAENVLLILCFIIDTTFILIINTLLKIMASIYGLVCAGDVIYTYTCAHTHTHTCTTLFRTAAYVLLEDSWIHQVDAVLFYMHEITLRLTQSKRKHGWLCLSGHLSLVSCGIITKFVLALSLMA